MAPHPFKPACLLIALVFSLCAAAALPAASPDHEADRVFVFAGQLMEEEDYYRAITEYKRFLSYFPEDERVPLSRLNIALAYKRGGKTDLAVEHFRQIREDYAGDGLAERASYEIGASYFQNGRYQDASAAFSEFIRSHPDSPRLDAGRLLLGWSLVHLWELEGAAQAFSSVSGESPQYLFASGLTLELEAGVAVPGKSPVLAGILSAVLPGSGQVYTGRLNEGLTSFILNGSFIWAVVELFGHGNEVAGVILGFFETGWYTGGVFGAVNDAHKYNRKSRRDFILELETRFPPPSIK